MQLGKNSKIAQTGSDIEAQVSIGNYTSIGPHVKMCTRYDHACIKNPQFVSTYQLRNYPGASQREKITIGSDVWIGRNAVLLGGITIGDGAIIGAFSVVAKDIPPYAVVIGNPCKIIRYRFTPRQIKKLLSIQWWNWPDEKIEQYKEKLLDVDALINMV